MTASFFVCLERSYFYICFVDDDRKKRDDSHRHESTMQERVCVRACMRGLLCYSI